MFVARSPSLSLFFPLLACFLPTRNCSNFVVGIDSLSCFLSLRKKFADQEVVSGLCLQHKVEEGAELFYSIGVKSNTYVVHFCTS